MARHIFIPQEWTDYVTASASIALNILSGLSGVRLSFVHHDWNHINKH